MKEIDNREEIQKPKRIDSSYLTHEIQHILHLESGFLFTVKELFIHPGKFIRNFISKERSKATKPVIFLIISATIFTIILRNFFHGEWQFFSVNKENIDQYLVKKTVGNWMNTHIGYTALMIGILMAIWTKVFFRKHGYNIFEIVVLFCYSIGQTLLIIALFFLSLYFVKTNLVSEIGIYIGFFYTIWSVGQFFGEKNYMNYVKSFFCSFLGALTFRLILNLIITVNTQL
ncbi:MAG: DUF3667 domain-containing protein [Leadbetterella sp.]